MKLSDRDFKLVMLVVIALVIALPILLVIRPYGEKTKALQGEIAELTVRQEYLNSLDANREFYNNSITLLENERNKLIEAFAAGIRNENTIMLLANAEKGTPITLKSVAFTDNDPIVISEGYFDEEGNLKEGLTANSRISTIAYECEYSSVKAFLDFVLKYPDRMVVSTLTAKQSEVTGLVEGVLVLNQHAVTGEGRTLAPAVIPEFQHKNDNIFGTPVINGEPVVVEEEQAEEE